MTPTHVHGMQVYKLVQKDEVDVFMLDNKGHTALHMAAIEGHVGVVRALAAAGGMDLVCKPSNSGRTAVEYAAFYANEEVEQVLQELLNSMEHEKLQWQKKLEMERKEQEKRDMVCRPRAAQMAAEYAHYQPASSPLDPDEYEDLAYWILMTTLAAGMQQMEPRDGDRFVIEPKDLVCGEFEQAAKGFSKLLNISENEVNKLILDGLGGVSAIVEEVRALGNKDVAEQLDYILHKPASEKAFPNGIRDKGHTGMRLKDFVEHEHARSAELEVGEVVALRLYTTSAYKEINTPLRDQERISRCKVHPLPVTVTLIARGIKKLRAIIAGGAAAIKPMVLWRGVKNVRPTDHFAEAGGTEVCRCLPFSRLCCSILVTS